MERRTDLITAERIMCENYIGPEQLEIIKNDIGILSPYKISKEIPFITFSNDVLEKKSKDYILILGIPIAYDSNPLTINKLKSLFGSDSTIKEPCFYNQDWYISESFSKNSILEFKWYLLKKNVYNEYRGVTPNSLFNNPSIGIYLPSAILCTFSFFAYYLIFKGKYLWENDFVWCSDYDHNKDRIYVGRYIDPTGINKNGFSIHRHLSITNAYSYIDAIL